MRDIIKFDSLESKLITINHKLVLLDKDVAKLYGIEAKKLRQQLKRNIEKFPEDYAYKLSQNDLDYMGSQNVTPSKQSLGGHLPYVFTEKGLYMVATILKSEKAIQATFTIIETFAKIKELSRNLNSLDSADTKAQQEKIAKATAEILEDIIDIEPTIQETEEEIIEVETRLELNIGFVKASRLTKKKIV